MKGGGSAAGLRLMSGKLLASPGRPVKKLSRSAFHFFELLLPRSLRLRIQDLRQGFPESLRLGKDCQLSLIKFK